PMDDSSGPDFQEDKHVDHAKCGGYDDKEISGEDPSGGGSPEGAPFLSFPFRARPSRRRVSAPRPRWDPNAALDEELGGNAFLAPRRIRTCHGGNEVLQICWNRWATSRTRFPPPKQPESLSMPADQRLRLDDGQELSPLEAARQRDERDACGVIG